MHPCNAYASAHTATVPQGQEGGLAENHEEQVNTRGQGRQHRRKSQKKPREVFESSGIPLLLCGSSGRRQEPVERAREDGACQEQSSKFTWYV